MSGLKSFSAGVDLARVTTQN